MHFDKQLLEEYQKLLKTTNLQRSYKEFISLFRYIRIEPCKQLSDYDFQGNIVENSLDYSYFQFTNDKLKNMGLKIAITFVHKDFQFEVWLSGFNRQIQCKYFNVFVSKNIPFELTDDAKRKDYILKAIIKDFDISNANDVIDALKSEIFRLIDFVNKL